MSVTTSSRRARQKGSIDRLRSGALRVRVYAGTDPVTKRRHYLTEVVPAGPRAETQAEAARVRLVNEVNERRNPRTNAMVNQLVDRHLKQARLDLSTLETYKGYVHKHIKPLLGKKKVGVLDAEILDAFYAELARCRDHCSDGRGLDHRTPRPHECDERCGPHVCKPLGASAIRQIHWILSGALRRAKRWKWISVNPASTAEPPAPPPNNPQPPSAEEAARLANEAWKDPDWGLLVWVAMVTGLRRGELCGLRWRHIDLDIGVIHLGRSIGQRGRKVYEKDTKAHQDRRIFLDPDSLDLLREHRLRCEARAEAVGVSLFADAFVFSLAPDGQSHLRPNSVTSRYSGMAERLGIRTSIHKLRHYSATELIAAGVDIRTVAGRLGHAGGGTTTLRTYAAWVAEADQRAANTLVGRMPPRPRPQAVIEPEEDSEAPYVKIAKLLYRQIMDGVWSAGFALPAIKSLATEHGVAVGTAQRAVAKLREWGVVEVMAGRRTLVRQVVRGGTGDGDGAAYAGETDSETAQVPSSATVEPLDLEVRRLGQAVAEFRTNANLTEAETLHRLLLGAIKRTGDDASHIDDYELVVRRAGEQQVAITYVAAP